MIQFSWPDYRLTPSSRAGLEPQIGVKKVAVQPFVMFLVVNQASSLSMPVFYETFRIPLYSSTRSAVLLPTSDLTP